MPPHELKQMKYRFKHDYERQLVASPTDHNNPRSAGVAAIARSCDTLFEFKPITPAFLEFRECGRVIQVWNGAPWQDPLRFQRLWPQWRGS